MELEVRTYLRPYEALIIVHPDTSEEDQKNLFKRNKSIIESFKGDVKHLDTWGKRNLANQIGTSRKAYYFHTTFEAEPAAIAELERTMRINDHVLRFQHTRLDDGTNLGKFLENFKQALADSAAREREREAKFQARKAAQRGGPRRDFEGGGEGRGERGDRGGGDRPRGPRGAEGRGGDFGGDADGDGDDV
jgi:small subunit ribosomal protein S6